MVRHAPCFVRLTKLASPPAKSAKSTSETLGAAQVSAYLPNETRNAYRNCVSSKFGFSNCLQLSEFLRVVIAFVRLELIGLDIGVQGQLQVALTHAVTLSLVGLVLSLSDRPENSHWDQSTRQSSHVEAGQLSGWTRPMPTKNALGRKKQKALHSLPKTFRVKPGCHVIAGSIAIQITEI